MSTFCGFEHVLFSMKRARFDKIEFWRRRKWKPNACIHIADPVGFDTFIAVVTDDGRHAPWTPSRCDLLEDDWERFA